jgi:hypothetical protein
VAADGVDHLLGPAAISRSRQQLLRPASYRFIPRLLPRLQINATLRILRVNAALKTAQNGQKGAAFTKNRPTTGLQV